MGSLVWTLLTTTTDMIARLAMMLFLLCLTDGLPRYRFPFIYKPHRPSPVHHFNFVANGHPYKITVNNKELQPKLPPASPTSKPSKPLKHQATNSPITWIRSPLGFNGLPVNIISYPPQPPHSHINRIWGAPSGILPYFGRK